MEHKTKGPYTVLSSRNAYENPWLIVREDKVIRPGGKEGYFGIIEMKAGASVLALNSQHEVYLVSEYKYGIERDSIELMSGALEPDETPLDAAKRELKEELGLEADEWIDLGVVDPFTTAVHSPNYMFLAMGIQEGEPTPEDGEVLEIIKTRFSEAIEMVMRSEITHAASCVLILKAERYLQGLKLGTSV
jgi:8-oxo-dGTP pyrophosphatase MutT (NUDIX family)